MIPKLADLQAILARSKKKTHSHDGPTHPGYNLKPGIVRSLALAIATGLGTGYAPVASGTFGCIPGIILFWLLAPTATGWAPYILACVLVTLLGVVAANAAEGIYRKKDDGRIVIDEVAGMMITMIGAPKTGLALVAGFLLFRFFDIVKLAPANRLQSLRGGWGIMIDDVIAGVYACLSLHLFLLLYRLF